MENISVIEHEDLVYNVLCELCTTYIEEYGYTDEKEINCGDCEVFADEFISIMEEKHSSIKIVKMSTNDFTSDELIVNETLFDKAKLEKYFGHEFNDVLVNLMIKSNPGYHVWLYIDGKHYDSECVEGVDNPFKLPFFERSFCMYTDTDLYYCFETAFEILEAMAGK